MESRRDQVQAYFFVVGRLAAAVTHGRPNALEWPNRRLKLGIVIGILIGLLITGIFGVIGLLNPGGNDSWRSSGTIVQVDGTGTGYVYLDGTLRPVRNYASALLAAGGSGAVVSVAADSLNGTPVGQPIGIPGAPDAVPAAGKLHGGAWTVCSQPGDSAIGMPVVTVRLADTGWPGIGPERAVLVSSPDGTTYLLWHGKRRRVSSPLVLETLGYANVPVVQVTSSWLNPIPLGPDIGVPDTPDVGAAGPSIGGQPSRVGQVFQVNNPVLDRAQFYLLRQDGVAPLNSTAAALLLAKPSTEGAYPEVAPAPVVVGPAALKDVPKSTSGPDLTGKLPDVPPDAVDPLPDSALCARYQTGGAQRAAVTFQSVPAAVVEAGATPVATHVAGVTADRVAIPVGGGALVRPRKPAGPAYLISETGTRYPLQGEKVLGALGYSQPDVVAVPGALLELLPAGPTLTTNGALTS